jgi:DNA-binding MurR/RpiR family transcriptional regulator
VADIGDNKKTGDRLGERIRARRNSLTPTLARVANFIDGNRLEAMTKSAVELGALIGTSDATVIRTVQALGFGGLKDLKQELAVSFGEGQSAADNMVRTFSRIGDERDAALDRVFDDHREAFAILTSPETRLQISNAVDLLAPARRIGVFGLGPSSYLARYFALLVSRSGRPARAFDGSGAPFPDQILDLQDRDAMVMLAYGRPYKEATTFIDEVRRLRKPIVLVTDSPRSGLAKHASAVVTIPRGHTGLIALHGATFVCLEAIMLALASLNRPRAIETLERLNHLRKSVGKTPQ